MRKFSQNVAFLGNLELSNPSGDDVWMMTIDQLKQNNPVEDRGIIVSSEGIYFTDNLGNTTGRTFITKDGLEIGNNTVSKSIKSSNVTLTGVLELPNNSSTRVLALGVTDGASTVYSSVDGVIDISSLLGGGGGSVTASNGLTLSGSDVKLGGALTEPTTITLSGSNILTIDGGTMSSGAAVFINNSNGFGIRTHYDNTLGGELLLYNGSQGSGLVNGSLWYRGTSGTPTDKIGTINRFYVTYDGTSYVNTANFGSELLDVSLGSTEGNFFIETLTDNEGMKRVLEFDLNGELIVSNYTFRNNEAVGAPQDNYVLTYDNATNSIGLESSNIGINTYWGNYTTTTNVKLGDWQLNNNGTYLQVDDANEKFEFFNSQVTLNNFLEVKSDNGISLKNLGNTFYTWLKASSVLTGNRIIRFPDKPGTVALTSDIIVPKEEDIYSTTSEHTIVSGEWTPDITSARLFTASLTENTTITMPTLSNGNACTFTIYLTGDFTLNIAGGTTTLNSDSYDGTVNNRLICNCFKIAGIQTAYVSIENLTA